MVKSGILYSFGLGFWGANGHDGIWHIALINSLSKGLPVGGFQMPVFSGENIKNYHLGFDLILAIIHRFTNISVVTLYFQIAPIVLSLLVGVSIFLFVNKWKGKSSALWALFFTYFGGDMAWVFGKGESTFWAQQAVSTLINPPFALSIIFIFLGLYFLISKKLLLSVLFFGVLLETKAYAGVLILGSLFLVSVFEFLMKLPDFTVGVSSSFIPNRTDSVCNTIDSSTSLSLWFSRFAIKSRLDTFKVFLGALFISIITFLSLNRGSENVFIFSPFWFLNSLFAPDRFSFPKLYSALSNYKLSGNYVKLAGAYIVAFVVFWIGNLWTRLISLGELRKFTTLKFFMFLVVLAGIFIPMFFLQKGTPWNTVQFFYYSLVFSGILAGVAISEAWPFGLESLKNKFLILIIILLTIPTTIITLRDVYVPQRPPAKISVGEIDALDFLSRQKDGVVLTYPYDQLKAKEAEKNPPRPLYLYDSTAYVSAMSGKQTFMEDEVNLNITGFDWKTRRDEVNKFLKTVDQGQAKKFLNTNNISYVYWVKPQGAILKGYQLSLANIFENSEVVIYKVLK